MKTKPAILLTIILLFAIKSNAQISTVFGPDGYVQISEGTEGFSPGIEGGDRFSRDHDVAGDINGDGVLDLIVGARSDDDGATDAGAVYILFMKSDGTVDSHQKISNTQGGFTETLATSAFFGYGVAGIGDYDGDTIPDIAVSAVSASNNSVYIIHLNSNGTVKNYVKNTNIIAQGLTAIGDLNGDGRIDLVACNPRSNDGGTSRGAISLVFLDAASQVITSNTVTISSTQGGFGTGLNDGDEFGGRETAMLGDLDGDGTKELAVGSFKSDGGKGSVWILSLNQNNFNVTSKVKITEGSGGFTDVLTTEVNPNGTFGAQFGHAMCAPGDLNGDGIPDLITGANQQDEGLVYILYLNADKTVNTYTKINNTNGGFNIQLDAEERFSRSISFIGDLRGDGSIAVNIGGGAAGSEGGILYLLFFKPCDFNMTPGNNFYANGNTLFTNWNHGTQTVTGELTFEQCTTKAFETDAASITFNPLDGRCICKDETAILNVSTENSFAYTNSCYSNFQLSVSEFSNDSNILVFPNPATNELNLELNGNIPNLNSSLSIYSIDGRFIKSSSIETSISKIDISSISSGIYLLKINLNEDFIVKKFVKK